MLTTARRGELRQHEPLANYTTWRVGGVADRFYCPADREDLAAFLAQLPESEPLLWLGRGSNLLVRDGGFRGTVIALRGVLSELELLAEGRVGAGAGVTCAHLARFLARQKLTGGEFWRGIPGTLGGALALNAGAFGGQTWDLVREVSTIDRRGERRVRTPEEFQIGYREVKPSTPRSPEWFLGAELQLEAATDESGYERMQELLDKRARTQPLELPSAGSTFRNPEGDYAARLIESSGLKGYRLGGACVSSMHANFIVNTGNATAADIESLIEHVQLQVEKLQGIRLIPEVHIVGELEGLS